VLFEIGKCLCARTIIGHFTEDAMAAVELRKALKGDEELRCVRVLSTVGHAEHSALVRKLQASCVVFEGLVADGGLTSRAVVLDKVAGLRKESIFRAEDFASFI